MSNSSNWLLYYSLPVKNARYQRIKHQMLISVCSSSWSSIYLAWFKENRLYLFVYFLKKTWHIRAQKNVGNFCNKSKGCIGCVSLSFGSEGCNCLCEKGPELPCVGNSWFQSGSMATQHDIDGPCRQDGNSSVENIFGHGGVMLE